MKTFLLLNGDPPLDTSQLKQADYIVCADGAYNWAKSICTPHCVIGDMDSVVDLPKSIPQIVYPRDKDSTDGQLALEYLLKKQPQSITILGARGGRADHEYCNYFLLTYKSTTTCIKLDLDQFFCELVDGNFSKNIGKNKIVSLSPFMGQVHISNTKGLQYPIIDKSFRDFGTTISNITTQDSFGLTVVQGRALVFYAK